MITEEQSYEIDGDQFSICSHTVEGFHAMPSKHCHDKFEIYYLVSGERYYFVRDKIFRIRKGYLIFVNENELHRITDTELPDYRRTLVYFTKSFLNAHQYTQQLMDFLGQKPCWVLSLNARDQLFVENMFDEMAFEISNQREGYGACVQGLLLRLLAFAARHLESYDSETYISGSPRHKKVSVIIKYLQENYIYPLSVPAIAGHFFISPCYLSRIFKETTGYTLVEYLKELRLKEAHSLLTLTELKVIDIAGRTGFGSVTQFNRVFKEAMGCSPLQYRKKHRKPLA